MSRFVTADGPDVGTATSPDPAPVLMSDWRAALPTMSSHGVTLREPEAADALSLLTALSDVELGGLLPELPTSSAAGFDTLIARVRAGRQRGVLRCWAVATAETGMPIGLIGLRSLDPAGTAVEGFAVIANEFRGSTAFQVAARLALSSFFESMGGQRIEFRVDVRNGRANGAIRKLGARQEGVLRRARRSGDDFHDQVLWAIVAADWHATSEPPSTGVH